MQEKQIHFQHSQYPFSVVYSENLKNLKEEDTLTKIKEKEKSDEGTQKLHSQRFSVSNIESQKQKVEKNHKKDQEKQSSKSKLLCFILVLLSLGFLVVFLTLHFQEVFEPKEQQEPQTIIERNFKVNQVYKINYVVTNDMNDSLIRTNYTALYMVQSTNKKSGETSFAGVLQKRSEQKITEEETQIQWFDQSTIYEDLLKNGSSQSQNQEEQQNQTEIQIDLSDLQQIQGLNISESDFFFDNATDSSGQQPKEANIFLPVFKFSLLKTGNITSITFPVAMDKETLGILKTFIRMFSPLTQASAYENKSLKKIKRQYKLMNIEEEESYDYEKSDTSVTLKGKGHSSSSGETHNTEEQTSQESKFSNEGTLEQASLAADTSFKSVPEEPNDNYSTFNSGLNFEAKQEAKLHASETFEASETNAEQFLGFITNYEESNETYTMHADEINQYILGNQEQDGEYDQGRNGTRLLLEQDGSLSIISEERELIIMKTNLIGLKVVVFGYLMINLNLYEDEFDKYKKQPLLTFQSGTVLKLGNYRYVKPVVQYEKKFPPFTLKFTLNQIEGVVNLFKGDFIGRIKEIKQLLSDGFFEGDVISNILSVVSVVEDVNNAITDQQDSNSPMSVMRNIFNTVLNVKQILQSKGLALLDPQNEFASNLTSGLLSYANISYQDALTIFENVKGNLSSLNNQGQSFFNDMLNNYTQNSLESISSQIFNLIPPDLVESYNEQIKKAKAILDFIVYVKDQGLKYGTILEEINSDHKKKFLDFCQRTIDLYFQNQTLVTEPITSLISKRLNQVIQKDYNQYSNQLTYVQPMIERTQRYFWTLMNNNLASNSYQEKMTSLLSSLSSAAQAVNAHKGSSCCKKKRKFLTFWTVTCVVNNDMYDEQVAEQQHFNSLKTFIQNTLPRQFSQVKDFMAQFQKIMKNSNLSLPNKFLQFEGQIQGILQPFTSVVQNITARINQAQYIKRHKKCGSFDGLNNYLSYLSQLLSHVKSFQSEYQNVVSKFKNIKRDFSGDVFEKIVSTSKIEDGINIFLNQYKSAENETQKLFSQINQIFKGKSSEQFVSSSDIMNLIFNLYEKTGKTLHKLCETKQNQESSISMIREGYKQKLNSVSSLSSSYFGIQLTKTKQFLSSLASSAFETYKNIPFCEVSESYRQKIDILIPEFENYTIILDLYTKFNKFWDEQRENFQKLKEQVNLLKDKFLSLFKADDYQQFILETSNLVKKVEKVINRISIKMSDLKQETKNIFLLNIADQNQLEEAIKLFETTDFPLSPAQMFQDLRQLSAKAQNTIKNLSFDVISIIVLSQNIKDYFNETVNNFKEGIPEASNNFVKLCKQFISLDSFVTQQYLNEIDSDFRKFITSLNNTLFPDIDKKLSEIENKFKSIKFSSNTVKKVYEYSLKKLKDFSKITTNTKENIFKKIQDLNQKVLQLINMLEIGSLNTIYNLAQVIKEEFSNIFTSFPSLIKEILSFENIATKDFNKLFNFKQFLREIEEKVQKNYHDSITNIKEEIQKANHSLSTSSDFYNKFINSDSYEFLKNASLSFKINFEELWGSADGKLSEINDFVQQITGDAQGLLRQCSTLTSTFKEIRSNVEERIRKIKQQFKVIKNKLFSLQNLIFILLRSDLKETVMGSVNNILDEVDAIIEVQLAKILIAADGKYLSKIKKVFQLIEKAIDGYTELKVFIEQKFISKLQNGLDKIDEFIEDKLSQKFQKLKDAMILIKSKTNLEEPQQSIVLYENYLAKKRVPIFKYFQVIPTFIGMFIMQIDLKFFMGLAGIIEIVDFRNLKGGLKFESSLEIGIFFSYGLCYILQFGLFVQGKILIGQIYPALTITNIIPTQLVEPLTGMTQFEEGNKIGALFTVDLELNSYDLYVGFFIKYITVEIIWQPVKICFKVLWKKICLHFKIPIGFRLLYDLHEKAQRYIGKPLFKKEIYRKAIL